jgi:hypothetical protein
MRIPRWAVVVTTAASVAALASGCSDDKTPAAQASASASVSASASTIAPSTGTPSTSPSPSSAATSPSAVTIVPRNVIVLQGEAPKALPTHNYVVDNGNDYPKLVFLILRDVNKTDGVTVPVEIKFGQIGTDEYVDCGNKVYGGAYANKDPAAVWCYKYQMLLSAPGVIIADHGNDTWGVLRDLIGAFSGAQLGLKGTDQASTYSVACYSGRTIRSLREHGYLSGPDASSLVRSYGEFNAWVQYPADQLWRGFAEARCA